MSSDDGWVSNVLGDVLARCQREQQVAEQHAATCTARPCERCERYACSRCGSPIDGRRTCDACQQSELVDALMRPTEESIPKHFRWAMRASAESLRARVKASPALIERGIKAPPSTGLLLLGATGTGKTSLAVAMLHRWVSLDPRARTKSRFVEASQLSRARARHRLGADEAPLVVEAMTCPLLVLDDLGAEREDRDGCITDVIWTRTNEDLPTWITCGLSSSEQSQLGFASVLGSRYDGGFARRIIESSKHVQLGGK